MLLSACVLVCDHARARHLRCRELESAVSRIRVCVTLFCVMSGLLFKFKLMLIRVIRDGWTALHFASYMKHLECMEVLMAMKADVNMRDACVCLGAAAAAAAAPIAWLFLVPV